MSVKSWASGMIHNLWTTLVGMRITLRYMLTPPVTMHYPDEKWMPAERFRGQIKCDIEACIVCDLCVKACPVECITINWERREGVSGKVALNFIVDYEKCIVCGLCTEPCPTNAIFHSKDYELGSYSRAPQVIDWARPENKVINPKRKPMKEKKAAAPKKATPTAAQATHAQPATTTATATASPTEQNALEVDPSKAQPGQVLGVWIEPGCIVCDLCEDTAPEVFKVGTDTSVVIPDNLEKWPELSQKIIDAAAGCPVNVIKYKTK